LKVTCTEEAIADSVEAISISTNAVPPLLRTWTQRSRAASNVWKVASSKGQFHGYAPALLSGAGACRRSGFTTSGILTNC
jgi:hypothetical protein